LFPVATPTAPKSSSTARVSTAVPTAIAAAPAVTPSPAPSPIPVGESAAARALTRLFAQWTGQPEGAIKIADGRQVDWMDACFGAGRANESCLQAITPGYELTFEINDATYVVRSDLNADSYRLVSASEPDIGAPIVEWSGEPGTCGHVVVGLAGVAFGECEVPLIQSRVLTRTAQHDASTLRTLCTVQNANAIRRAGV
jgi:hypothetical protein